MEVSHDEKGVLEIFVVVVVVVAVDAVCYCLMQLMLVDSIINFV